MIWFSRGNNRDRIFRDDDDYAGSVATDQKKRKSFASGWEGDASVGTGSQRRSIGSRLNNAGQAGPAKIGRYPYEITMESENRPLCKPIPGSASKSSMSPTRLAWPPAPAPANFDAILFDLYRGPHFRTDQQSDPLYGSRAIDRVHKALNPDGVFAVWGENYQEAFVRRLEAGDFAVTTERPGRGGLRHVVFLAKRMPGRQSSRPGRSLSFRLDEQVPPWS